MDEDDVIEKEWDELKVQDKSMNDYFAQEPRDFGGGRYY